MTSPRRRIPARRASRGLLALVAVVAGVLLVELGLRLLPEPGLRGLHVLRPDRPWLYELRPGAQLRGPDGTAYRINAQGFRDRLRSPSPAPGGFRVIVLGDSIAFGYRVARREAFPAQLETQLRRAARARDPAVAHDVEVLDWGVSGYNPYNEAALLAGRAAEFAPDLVLAQFCVNDLNDPTLHFGASTQLALGSLPKAAYPDPAARRRRPRWERACLRSHLCRALLALARGGFAAPRDEAQARRSYAPIGSDRGAAEWEWLGARYREMQASARSMGARFGVVVFPYRDQLVDAEAPAPQPALRALGRAGGWPTIDLLDAFREAAGAEPLFLDIWHPTAAGHRIAAARTALALRCAALVPGPPPDAARCREPDGSSP